MKKQLYYQYKSHCPDCKSISDHYLILAEFDEYKDQTVIAEGNCKCGYKGMVEIKYVGRVFKPYNVLINPHLIDPN